MEKIAALRKEKGWTQAKLGVLAEVDPSTVNQIERGMRRPNGATLEKLAGALGVEVVDLFGRAEAPKGEAPSTPGPHEGLVRLHRTAAAMGRTVAHSFTNFQRRDLEHLKTFHELEAALAQMRSRNIYGHGPEDLADAQDELEAASLEVHRAMQEHFGVDTSLEPWGDALQQVLEEMEARQRV